MKKFIFTSLVVAMFAAALNSCKKETAARNNYQGGYPGKIRSILYTGAYATSLYQNPNTSEFYYNADGSLSKIVFLDSGLHKIGTENYTYTASKVVATQADIHTGASISYMEYRIDGNGVNDSLINGISSYKKIYVLIIENKSGEYETFKIWFT